MNITVEYMAQLRAAAETPTDNIEVAAPATVETAINAIVRKHSDRFSSMLLNDGRLKPHILVWVDDEPVYPAHALSPGSRILLLSPISGG